MSEKSRHLLYILLAALACAQWPLLRAAGLPPPTPWTPLSPGLAIFGAAFLLSWAA